MSAPEGRTLGSYRLLERIGKGGMGEVYRAQHLKLGREAAIKVLPPALAAEADFLKRFEREAASAAALNHPNILQVYDYGEQDGTPYLVMPYISGGTLKDRLVGGNITPAQFARALTEVAGALDYAHRQGIVHRDVKPANVLIDDYERAYLADFGIAKAVAGGEALTQTGLGVGTPEYMAPEQAQGRAEPRSDLYALGIMLFQLLTGNVPYSGTSTVEVLLKHMQEPIPLGALHGPTAREFGPILTRALAKDPNKRYPTGRELMDAANTGLARIGYADPGGSAAYHSGATQGPQREGLAPTGPVAPAPPPRQSTPPPATPPTADGATMVRPTAGNPSATPSPGTPPPATQFNPRPTSGPTPEPGRPATPPPVSGPWTPATPATNGGNGGNWGANPADRQAASSEPTRFGPDDATRYDPGRPATPPPAGFGSALPPTQFGTAPPPNAYQPPFGSGAPVQQVMAKGGGPFANMDENTRRLVIIIAVVVSIALISCCCLFGLSALRS